MCIRDRPKRIHSVLKDKAKENLTVSRNGKRNHSQNTDQNICKRDTNRHQFVELLEETKSDEYEMKALYKYEVKI